MKLKLYAAVAIAAAALSGTATAAVVRYTFTAVVNDLYEYDNATSAIVHVDSSNFAGGPVALGNLVQGQFSFNTDAPLSGYQPTPPTTGTYLLYDLDPSLSSMSFTIGTLGFISGSTLAPLGQVANNASNVSGWDVFSYSASKAYDPIMFQSGGISLFDSSGTAFSSPSLPSSLNLSSFSYRQLSAGWLRQADGDQLLLSATLLSLDPVAAVSEPSSHALLAAGLLGIAWVRRRLSGARSASTNR